MSKTFTKEEVVTYMANQGLVYSGLEKYIDEWFKEYHSQWFECIGDDKYVLIDE